MIRKEFLLSEELAGDLKTVRARLDALDSSRKWTEADVVRFSLALGLLVAAGGLQYSQTPTQGPPWPKVIEAAWERYANVMDLNGGSHDRD